MVESLDSGSWPYFNGKSGTNAFLASHSKLLGTLHVAGSLSPPFFWPPAIIKGFDPRPDSPLWAPSTWFKQCINTCINSQGINHSNLNSKIELVTPLAYLWNVGEECLPSWLVDLNLSLHSFSQQPLHCLLESPTWWGDFTTFWSASLAPSLKAH